jgi:hypothetical protein
MKKTLGETIGELRQEAIAYQGVITGLEVLLKDAKEEAVKAKDYQATAVKQAAELRGELEHLHKMLDNLPGAPLRRPEGASSWDPELPVIARLCVYLSGRGRAAA